MNKHDDSNLIFKQTLGGLVLASLLWFVMFGLQIQPFWPIMTGSTLLLILYSSICLKSALFKSDSVVFDVILGVLSAIVLYAVFYCGNILFRHIPGPFGNQINTIYLLKTGTPSWVLLITLIFPIGPGEEIFWRGFIQDRWIKLFGPYKGFVFSTLLYTAVHLPAGNPVLLVAAMVCGSAWGALYLWRKSIIPIVISHVLWDIAVFILFPFNT